mgnify:CR=1 FL=1
MWSLARGMAQYSLKNFREYPKTSGQSLVGFAHSGLPPQFLDILSRFFVNILPSTLANLNILLQYVTESHRSALPEYDNGIGEAGKQSNLSLNQIVTESNNAFIFMKFPSWFP